ncbi:hypothetical protein NP493_717g00047 [Ridgeia piscesae]|uniref:Grh/CP2 DB domain-containing protein n=1 Tax=Ridgeia piscesae TaxID=27915 RepID=A0AAD9KQI3_RIDPI|nr:hypothetical protein NP493_717g00047 [Ridgeia piscesae]
MEVLGSHLTPCQTWLQNRDNWNMICEALLALPVFKQEALDAGFQYVLNAATSPATKLNEETLTYLNQGQSYELKLKKLGELGEYRGKLLKSVVRVVFHERRLQFMEREQLATWRQTRPGERILDIDLPLSYGINDIKVDPVKLNVLEFWWDPSKDVGVYIKVHCISTEFTARKHGGERGVPFRIQIETYVEDCYSNVKLVYCASCQVKVFKPKGADRKHKTDKEKIEKRSEAEKEKFQPSYECTVLTEIPLEQAKVYLEQLHKSAEPHYDTSLNLTSFKLLCDLPSLSDDSSRSSDNRSLSFVVKNQEECPATVLSPVKDEEPPAACSLTSVATAHQVTQWLHSHRFSAFVKIFQNFTGADLLRLSRDDLIQICGLADGIRLNNALQSRNVRPKLTIYVCQKVTPIATEVKKVESPSGVASSTSNACITSSTPPPSSNPTTVSPSTSPTQTCPLGSVTGSTPSQGDVILSLSQRVSCTCLGERSPPAQRSTPNEKRGPQVTPHVSSKRQLIEHDLSEEVCFSKKQKTRILELSRKEVYMAVYLDSLTHTDLCEKIASLFSIETSQVIEMFVQGPSGIHILITDDVVQNFSDQARYFIEAIHDDKHPDTYRILLKSATAKPQTERDKP